MARLFQDTYSKTLLPSTSMTHYYTDAPTWTTDEVNFLIARADKAEKEHAETRTLLAQMIVDLKTATDTLKKKRRCRHRGKLARADKAEKELAETRTLLAQMTVDLKTATDTPKKRRCRHCGVVAPSETAEEERLQDEMWAEFDVRRRREAARDEAERRRKAAVEAGAAVEWVSGVVWR